ncbi:MAG: hypothetical protein ABWK04_02855 [Hydrogenobacter sp.]|uniref:hypothetical protein n=1 Tax=Hydrogenobacter thermophilus TaxID=940 RepID=UPI0030F8B32F
MEVINRLPTWQKYTILLGLPAILIIYVLFLFVLPAKEEVNKITAEKERIQEDIQNIQRSMNPKTIENLKKKEEETRRLVEEKDRELATIVGTIPTERDVSLILKSIGVLAKKSGLTIANVQMGQKQETTYTLETFGNEKLVKEVQPKPQQQQQKKQEKKEKQKEEGVKYLKADVKITLTGTYPAFERFMEGMAKGGIISYPSNLQISYTGESKLRGELDIFVLVKKEEEK